MYIYQLTLNNRRAVVVAENLFDATYRVEQEDKESWYNADIRLISEIIMPQPMVLALEQKI